MYKKRIVRLTSVILALLMLVSCAPKNTEGASSIHGDNETHNAVISDEQAKTETNEKEEIKENETAPENKTETQKPVSSSQSQKTEINSKTPDTLEKKPDNTTASSKPKEETSSVNSSEEVSSEPSTSETTIEDDVTKRKYIMPPDNPEPVEVNRENAHIPVPISFTSALQDGEAVEYKMTNTHYEAGVDSIDRYISIINSYDELVKPFDVAKGEYDEAFFEQNSLIALYLIEGKYKARHEVKSVTQKDGQMCIHVKRVWDGMGYAATHARVFIQISKEDLKNIKNIVVYEEKSWRMVDGEIESEKRKLRRNPHVVV